MTHDVAVVASDYFALENPNSWESMCESYANDVETQWNAEHSSDYEVSVDGPLSMFGFDTTVPAPNVQEPVEDEYAFLDYVRGNVEYYTDLLDAYDAVIVQAGLRSDDLAGVAYLPQHPDWPWDTAAGSEHGVCVVFEHPDDFDPTRSATSMHELGHLFSARHEDAEGRDCNLGAPICQEATVMGNYGVDGCGEGPLVGDPTQMEFNDCAEGRIEDYVDNHMP